MHLLTYLLFGVFCCHYYNNNNSVNVVVVVLTHPPCLWLTDIEKLGDLLVLVLLNVDRGQASQVLQRFE